MSINLYQSIAEMGKARPELIQFLIGCMVPEKTTFRVGFGFLYRNESKEEKLVCFWKKYSKMHSLNNKVNT
jgi:hypothetical protein